MAHGIEERDFDVEEKKDHRDEVELHRLPLAGVADGRHAAFIGRGFFGSRVSRTEQAGKHDRDQRETGAEPDHDHDGEPALHG